MLGINIIRILVPEFKIYRLHIKLTLSVTETAVPITTSAP